MQFYVVRFQKHATFYFNFYLQIKISYIYASKFITLNITIESNDIDLEINQDLYIQSRDENINSKSIVKSIFDFIKR